MRNRLVFVTLLAATALLSGCARGFWITNNTDRPCEITTTNDATGDRFVVTLKPGETRAFSGSPIDMNGLLIYPR